MEATRRYAQWISTFDESRRAALYSEEFLARLPESDPLDFLTAAFARSAARDRVTSTMLTDLVTYLPGDLMTKVDIASMAVGLECRMPWLDHRVVELAAAMPLRLKYRRGHGKWILRQAFGELIPSEIFRRGKMGFGVPLEHWFRGELKALAHEVLLDPRTADRGYFRPAAIKRLLAEHVTARFNHAHRLWALLVLELWHREWIDAP
jgi:asparagine synthase (glutamine-hydrolysing)